MAAQPPFFVNLPLSYIHRDRFYLEFFLERKLSPEFGLDAQALEEQDEAWHRGVAAELSGAGLSCSVHLPFLDLQPGSLDDLILKATRQRLLRALRVARIYSPVHLVGHAAFNENTYDELFSSWVSRAAATWRQVLSDWPGHPPLFLENTLETDPSPLTDLLAELTGYDAGFCLDVGHWFSFGKGWQRRDLAQWLVALRPHLRHLHLHDNDGSGDQHLGLGQGAIPWDELFQGLQALGLQPTQTLEPHTREDLEHSLEFLARHSPASG